MKTLRNIIIVALITLSLAGIYFGSVRAFIKGSKYIGALQKKNKITSVEGFEKAFRDTLDYKAPISDDELIKFISGDVIDMIAGQKQSEEVQRRLLAFIEGYMHERDVLHLLNIGRSYHFLWIQNGMKEEDFKKAEEYYGRVLEAAPNIPPALYGMLDLYRVTNNVEQAEIYAKRILELWPEDERVQKLFEVIDQKKITP